MDEEAIRSGLWLVIGVGAWSLTACAAYYAGWWKGFGAALQVARMSGP